MHNLLYFAIWYYNMCEAEAFRFREPKTVVEEEDPVDKAIPTSTKYESKWALTIFSEWQSAQGWSTVNSNRRYECIFFDLLAEQICHGSSEKEWRKVSSNDYVWHHMRNPTLSRREERSGRIKSAR